MIHTPERLTAKAAELRQLLANAADALADADVIDIVTRFALAHPEIAWEPVTIAAAALNAKRDRENAKAKIADPLADTVRLPQAPGPSAGGGVGGVSLPPPPWGFA